MIEAFLNGDMVWRAPIWLWALALPLAIGLMQRLLRNSQKQNYADSHLWPWVAGDGLVNASESSISKATRPGYLWRGLTFLKTLLTWLFTPSRFLTIAWLCFVIAIAGPRSLDTEFDVQTRNGVDVVIDIDLSQSMTAEDVLPNRFLFAKSIGETLVNQLEANDRVGLSVFAGQPHTVVPLTYDKNVFNQALNQIEPGMLPIKGSWLDLALIGALNVLTQTGRPAKVLVVFTDGAPPFWKPIKFPKVVESLEVTKSQKQSDTGVKVIYVGLGKTRSATIPDSSHSSGKLHVNGLLVQSRLEESQLMKLAQKTEGVYLRAEPGQDFMQKLVAEVMQTAASYQDATSRKVWINYAQPFMVVGLISLLLAFYLWQITLGLGQASKSRLTSLKTIGERRKTNSSSLSVVCGLVAIQLATILTFNIWPTTTMAAEEAKSDSVNLEHAYQAFSSESYELAQALYDASPNFEGWFGAGAAAYKQDDIESAVLYFRQAAWQAPSELQRAQALYNLGNSYYQANLLPQAIESFQQALKYHSPYDKAKHNLALAQERHQLELQGKLKKQKKEGKGEGEGSQGSDSAGAFYGGQKPADSDSKDQGVGSDGDSSGGNRHGNKVNLPDSDELTDYRLNPSIAKLRLNSLEKDSSVNKVIRAQQNQQRAEKFEHELQQLKDDQKILLKRIFERDAGFQAKQEKAHAIPGIQPW